MTSSSLSSLDANIPVLTEVIQKPATDAPSNTQSDTRATPAPSAVQRPLGTPITKPVAESLVMPRPPVATFNPGSWGGTLSAAEWERMEASLRERVLAELMGRIDELLAQRLRNSIADVLQLTAERMAEDIHDSLRASLREVVARAVAQEIRKARSLENPREI